VEHLKEETGYFERHREEWLRAGHEGRWAVVHGDTLIGFYPSLGEAYQAGLDACGMARFLVRQVSAEERVEIIHRIDWGGIGA